jgi:uncharacterized membrane protein
MKHERIGALADGIFAIAMTLLILDIHVPQVATLQWQDLQALIPKLATLAISFVLLGIYWSSHHMLFDRLTKGSFKFMWRNIWFLLTITLVPFAAALLGEYPYSMVAQIVYAAVLVISGLQLYGAIYYSVHTELLFTESPSVEFRRNVAGKLLISPFIYVIAMAVSTWDPHVSLWLLIVGPAIYFLPIDSKLWSLMTKPFARYIV